jgi:hypothetical protein
MFRIGTAKIEIKMANALAGINHVTPPAIAEAKPQAGLQATANPKASQPQQVQAKSPVPKDTVQISTAAQSALQESRETQAQTSQEASRGDRQAARLLAKESAAKKS